MRRCASAEEGKSRPGLEAMMLPLRTFSYWTLTTLCKSISCTVQWRR